MPDPSAIRNRRSRAHSAGDHSLCNPERCAFHITDRALNSGDNSAASAVDGFADFVRPDCRPCAVFLASARRLAVEVDAGNTRAAGELRHTVQALAGCVHCGRVDVPVDPLDELLRRREGVGAGPHAGPFAV